MNLFSGGILIIVVVLMRKVNVVFGIVLVKLFSLLRFFVLSLCIIVLVMRERSVFMRVWLKV